MSKCSIPDLLARRRSEQCGLTAVASSLLDVVDAGQQQQVKSSRRGGGLRTRLFLSSVVGPTRRKPFSASDVEVF
jgi:hypothetical protein